MKYKNAVVVLLLALLSLMACSDFESTEDVIARYDEEGFRYSPTELTGTVDYMPLMRAVAVRIVNVDSSLNPVDSFEISMDSVNFGSYTVNSQDYEYPYFKLVVIFPLGEKSKMEFPHYMRLSKNSSKPLLNLYGSLVAGRIEMLVQKENYQFNAAENEAYKELEKVLNVSIDKSRRFKKIEEDRFGIVKYNDMMPYLLMRHEISDSVFYEDYKDFSEQFAKKGEIDSSIIVRAADGWFSTFEVPSDSEQVYLFKSISRDTAVGLLKMDLNFFSGAYGLEGNATDSDVMKRDSVNDYSMKVMNKSSKFYGRSFAYEYVRGSSYSGWRVQLPLEDTLGICRYASEKYGENGKTSYLCREKTRLWEKLTDRDSVLKYKLGRCGNTSYLYYAVRNYQDTMLTCFCKDSKCGWRKVEDAKKDESLDSYVRMNIDATEQFGICDVLEGEKKKLDSLYIMCNRYRWEKIDSLMYYIGKCSYNNRDSIDKLPSGEYYKCSSDGWTPISVPLGYGDRCWNWKDSVYQKYDGKYYYCDGNSWREASEETVYPPVLNGDLCDKDHEKEVKKYGDESFVCRSLQVDYFVWLPLKEEKD